MFTLFDFLKSGLNQHLFFYFYNWASPQLHLFRLLLKLMKTMSGLRDCRMSRATKQY